MDDFQALNIEDYRYSLDFPYQEDLDHEEILIIRQPIRWVLMGSSTITAQVGDIRATRDTRTINQRLFSTPIFDDL